MTHAEKQLVLDILQGLIWAVNDLNKDNRIPDHELEKIDDNFDNLQLLFQREN